MHCADYWQSCVPEVKQEADQFDSIYAPSAIPFLLLILIKEIDHLMASDHLTDL